MVNEIEKTDKDNYALDLDNVDEKIMDLADKMIEASLSDKRKAEDTFKYIKTLINNTEAENSRIEEEIQQAKKDGKKPDRVYKRSVTGLLEQLNKSLDISISSTEKLVDLANICVKLKSINSKKTQADGNSPSGLRSQILAEIKDQKDQKLKE